MAKSYTKHGDVLEHRIIVELFIGRKLEKNEVVHHINGDVEDNRIENLETMTNEEHSSLHAKLRPAKTIRIICHHCHEEYDMFLRYYKYETFKGTTNFFCSKTCQAKSVNPLNVKYDEELRELVIHEHSTGKTGYQIAKDNNISKSTVYWLLKNHKD